MTDSNGYSVQQATRPQTIGMGTVVSGGGNDVISILGGADGVDAGAGTDRMIIDYSAAVTAVTGGVRSGNANAGYRGHLADLSAATLDFTNVEQSWITTGSGDDTITTGAGKDRIDAGASRICSTAATGATASSSTPSRSSSREM